MFKKVEKLKYRYNKEKRELVLQQKLAKKDIFAIILKNTMTDIFRKGDKISVTSKTVDGQTTTTIKFPDTSDFNFTKKYGLSSNPIFLFEIPDYVRNEEAAREKEIAQHIKRMQRIEAKKLREQRMIERKAAAAQKRQEREELRQQRIVDRAQKKKDREELKEQKDNERDILKAQKALEKEQEREEKLREKNKIGYGKADQLGRTKLTSLIQSRWESGQGLLSATGGAIGDKIKGFGVRMQRRLDPLGWAANTMGAIPLVGGFTKWATATALGALFNRDPEKIRHFGGWARDKKDPKRTKLGPGQIRNLESGDTSADILAKMYNFMIRDAENAKKERELEHDFKKENEDEAEKRHEKILETIKKLAGDKPETDGSKGSEKQSIFEKIIGGVYSAFQSVLKVVKGFASAIAGIFSGAFTLFGLVMGSLPSILEKLFTMVEGFSGILGGIGSFIRSGIGFALSVFRNLSTVLGISMNLIPAAALGILAKSVTDWAETASIFGASGEKTKTGELLSMINSMIGNDAALRPTAQKTQAEDILDASDKAKNFWEKRKRDGISISRNQARAVEARFGIKWPEELIQEDIHDDYDSQAETAYNIKRNPKSQRTERAWRDAIFNKKDRVSIEIAHALKDKYDIDVPLDQINAPDNYFQNTDAETNSIIQEQRNRLEKETKSKEMGLDAIRSQLNDLKDNASKMKELSLDKLTIDGLIPDMLEDHGDGEESKPEVISMNTNNTIGGQAKYSDTTPISPRIRNDSIQLALARTSFVV